MSYDFPANPTQDDEYTPPVGGQTYIYKAPRWLVKGIPPTGGEGGGGGIDEAPLDGKQYARFNATWSEVIIPAGTWDSITGKPATFPPTVPIAWTDVSGKPATYPPTLPIAWTDVSGKPATFPPTVPIDWSNITGQPATYPPTLPIAQSGVTGLTTDLDNRVMVAGDTMTGKLTFPASTTSTAPINIPQGTAPTSPATGDIWMDSNGLWYRTIGSNLELATISDLNMAIATSGHAPLNNPTFTGDPKAPTPTAGDNDTSIATTAFVTTAVATREPTIAPGTTSQYWRGDKTWQILPTADWNTLANKPSTFPPSTHSHPQSEVTNLVADLAAKEPTITAGTTAQYWRGDKTWQTLPTTDLSGYYTKAQADTKFVDVAGDTMTGNLTIAPSSGTASLSINKPDDATTNAVLYSQAAGVARWAFNLGSDGPSNFALTAFNNSGAFVGNAILGDRATALCTVVADPTAPLGIATKQYVDARPTGISDAPSDGKQYARKDAAWAEIAAPTGAIASIGDAAPSSPQHGQLWWNSYDGNLYIYYNDGSSSQWVQINTVGV